MKPAEIFHLLENEQVDFTKESTTVRIIKTNVGYTFLENYKPVFGCRTKATAARKIEKLINNGFTLK